MNNKKAVFFLLPVTLLLLSIDTMSSESWVELIDSFEDEATKPWMYRWVSKTSGDGSSGILYNAAEDDHYGYIRSATGRASLGRTVTLDMKRLRVVDPGRVGKCMVQITARKVTPANSSMPLRIEVIDLASWRYLELVDVLVTSNSYETYGSHSFFTPKGANIHIRVSDGDGSGATTAYISQLRTPCGTGFPL